MNRELHWGALAEKTKRVFRALAELPLPSHFYLAGGTGLALQIDKCCLEGSRLLSQINAGLVPPDSFQSI